MERKDNQIPVSQKSEGLLLPLPVKSKLLQVSLIDRGGKQDIYDRSISAYQIPADVLICSSKETAPDSRAATVVTTPS